MPSYVAWSAARIMNRADGARRDDVGRRTAVRDDAVDPGPGAELLAPQPDGVNRPIIASRAFRPSHGSEAAWDCRPVKVTSTSSLASRITRVCVRSLGWNSNAASMPSKTPVLEHHLLARPELLRGRAQEHDPPPELRRDRGQRDGGADAAGRHEVVAAAMSQARQGVVLGEHTDGRPIRPQAAGQRAAHRGRQAADAPLHQVPVGAIASATSAAARCSSKAVSGSAWMRCEMSRISVAMAGDDLGEARVHVRCHGCLGGHRHPPIPTVAGVAGPSGAPTAPGKRSRSPAALRAAMPLMVSSTHRWAAIAVTSAWS